MYILADINKIEENQDLYRNKDDFWKKVFLFMNICEMHILVDIEKNCRKSWIILKQRRHLKRFKTKNSYLIFFFLYLISISVKYISCRI